MKERLRKFLSNRFVLSFFGLLLVILVWEIIAYSTGLMFLPDFFSCLGNAFLLLGNKTTYDAIGFSLLRLLIALFGSGIAGILLGTIGGYYRGIGRLLAPLITILRSFPTVALILLLIVFVPNAAIWVVSLVLFPLIYQAAQEGAANVYQEYENLIRLKGKNHLSNITKVILPLSTNYILLSFVQALGLGLKIEIMAETFSYRTGKVGLGQLIYGCYQQVEYEKMMAYVLITLILILIADFVLKSLKRKIEKKRGPDKYK